MIVILTCFTSNKLFALMSLCCQTTEQKKMETDHLIQTKTDSKLFISNQMVRPNICILFLILYICPYVQLDPQKNNKTQCTTSGYESK